MNKGQTMLRENRANNMWNYTFSHEDTQASTANTKVEAGRARGNEVQLKQLIDN